jgi:hypothetical protein
MALMISAMVMQVIQPGGTLEQRPTQADDGVELAHDAQAQDRAVSDRRQALARIVAEDGQHAEAAVRNVSKTKAKLQRTLAQSGTSMGLRPLPAAAPAHLQLLLPIEAPQLLLVHHDVLSSMTWD